jgi:hypothetical protein
MVLTAYIVLSPVTGLFCHRRLQVTTCKLDASVGAPGPHDFAVRSSMLRLRTPIRPSHPAPTFVTIAKRPSYRDRTRESVELICPTAQAKYFCEKDWTRKLQNCPDGQISSAK